MNSTLELLNDLEWQIFYYAKLQSWLPLSSLPYVRANIQSLNTILDKNENELLIAMVDKHIQKVTNLNCKGTFHHFCLDIIKYMLIKKTTFEIALKRTHNLKAYQQLIYRKSDLAKIVTNSIAEYEIALKERQKVITIYQNERSKQVKELEQAILQIQNGSSEVVLSSELFTTLYYKQLLGYSTKHDALNENDPVQQVLEDMQEMISNKEKRVWGYVE